MNINNRKKYRSIIISNEVYRKLKELGNTADSFNDVIIQILTKNEGLESASRVGTREQTLTTSKPYEDDFLL